AFPTLPPDWPIARTARFKTKFVSRSVPVIQGSYFMRPERYVGAAAAEAARLCQRRPVHPQSEVGIDHVLRAYGVPAVQGMPAALLNRTAGRSPIIVFTDPLAVGEAGDRCAPGGSVQKCRSLTAKRVHRTAGRRG